MKNTIKSLMVLCLLLPLSLFADNCKKHFPELYVDKQDIIQNRMFYFHEECKNKKDQVACECFDNTFSEIEKKCNAGEAKSCYNLYLVNISNENKLDFLKYAKKACDSEINPENLESAVEACRAVATVYLLKYRSEIVIELKNKYKDTTIQYLDKLCKITKKDCDEMKKNLF